MRCLRWWLLVVVGMLVVVPEAAHATTGSPAERADELLAAMTTDQKSRSRWTTSRRRPLGVPPSLAGRADRHPATARPRSRRPDSRRDLRPRAGARIRRSDRRRSARQGLQLWLGPAMDIARTPLSGRQPENLGEDPFLAGETAAAGGAGAKSRHVIAPLKHFAANNQEWGRIGLARPLRRSAAASTSLVSERALQEIYVPPFKARSARAAPTPSCAPTTASTACRRVRTPPCWTT